MLCGHGAGTSLIQHLRVAIALPLEDAELARAALIDFPVPAERLVGGAAAAIVLRGGARFFGSQRRRGAAVGATPAPLNRRIRGAFAGGAALTLAGLGGWAAAVMTQRQPLAIRCHTVVK